MYKRSFPITIALVIGKEHSFFPICFWKIGGGGVGGKGGKKKESICKIVTVPHKSQHYTHKQDRCNFLKSCQTHLQFQWLKVENIL